MPVFRSRGSFKAVQWCKDGDHPSVFQGIKGQSKCDHCKLSYSKHGLIEIGPQRLLVCPGDWIIKYGNGVEELCRGDMFEFQFEPVEDEE